MIRPALISDAPAICAIYNHYITSTTVTFEEALVTAADMEQRIRDISAKLPWLVFEQDGQVAGYAYATPWRVRSAYRFSVESTVYVAPLQIRRGIGAQLYNALLERLRGADVRVVLGGIALPNSASVALHEHFGFEKAAHLRQVGRKFDQWIDVGYWQLLLVND
jgi:phosphinothricin acetyltransferase